MLILSVLTILGLSLISVAFATTENTTVNCSIRNSTRYRGLFADCHGRNLQRVPRLNKNIVALDLSGNTLILNPEDFNYSSLVYLNLSQNGLKRLPKNLFVSCQNLTILDLSVNSLKYDNKSFPKSVFRPLINLQTLNIAFNSEIGEYPDEIFQSLQNLQELTIDSFSNVNFPSGFQSLARLRLLNLSGKSANCNIRVLSNESFSAFTSTNLTVLDLSFCSDISEIQANAFAPLKHLNKLNLEGDRDLGMHAALFSLYGLQGFNMSTLNFRNLKSLLFEVTKTIYDQQLFAENLKYLENICVSELDISENHLLYINATSLLQNNNFSKCIKRIDLHENAFFGDYMYNRYQIWSMVMKLENLEYVDLSGFTCFHPNKNKNMLFQRNVSFFTNTLRFQDSIVYFLPKRLRTVLFDGATSEIHFVRIITVSDNNVLKTLSLQQYEYMVLEGRITGLTNLTTLKLGYNNHMTLKASIFDTLPSLENLYLNDVSLPDDYFYIYGRRLFKNLRNLVFLDISGNKISRLSPDIFKDNPNLQILILSNNNFITIPYDINNCPNLLSLKMDRNKVSYLEESTTSSLDRHYLKKKFKFDLSENRFICICGESLLFLSWLQDNNYTLNRKSYLCTAENGSLVSVMDYNAEHLWQSCIGQIWFMVALLITVFTVLGSVLVFFIIKHKTQLIYFFKNLCRKCGMCPTRKDFMFDVCLCYAEDDWRQACLDIGAKLERDYGYSVYLHDRNSVPGESIAEAIMFGINNSWKTVFLFTQDYLDDIWSWYQIQVGIGVVTWQTPSRLIILRETGRVCEIPNCILSAVDEDRIIPIPNHDNEESWESFVRLIT